MSKIVSNQTFPSLSEESRHCRQNLPSSTDLLNHDAMAVQIRSNTRDMEDPESTGSDSENKKQVLSNLCFMCRNGDTLVLITFPKLNGFSR